MIIEFLAAWIVTALIFNGVVEISLKERNVIFNQYHVIIIIVGSLITTSMAQLTLWMLNW